MFSYTRYFILMMTAVLLAFSVAVTVSPSDTTILEELDRSWSIGWINPEKVLITDRGGQFLLISLKTKIRQMISNVPAVTTRGQDGLLDVGITRIENDLWMYLAPSRAHSDNTACTELWRGRLVNDQL